MSLSTKQVKLLFDQSTIENWPSVSQAYNALLPILVGDKLSSYEEKLKAMQEFDSAWSEFYGGIVAIDELGDKTPKLPPKEKEEYEFEDYGDDPTYHSSSSSSSSSSPVVRKKSSKRPATRSTRVAEEDDFLAPDDQEPESYSSSIIDNAVHQSMKPNSDKRLRKETEFFSEGDDVRKEEKQQYAHGVDDCGFSDSQVDEDEFEKFKNFVVSKRVAKAVGCAFFQQHFATPLQAIKTQLGVDGKNSMAKLTWNRIIRECLKGESGDFWVVHNQRTPGDKCALCNMFRHGLTCTLQFSETEKYPIGTYCAELAYALLKLFDSVYDMCKDNASARDATKMWMKLLGKVMEKASKKGT
jgi:hypothetical protein